MELDILLEKKQKLRQSVALFIDSFNALADDYKETLGIYEKCIASDIWKDENKENIKKQYKHFIDKHSNLSYKFISVNKENLFYHSVCCSECVETSKMKINILFNVQNYPPLVISPIDLEKYPLVQEFITGNQTKLLEKYNDKYMEFRLNNLLNNYPTPKLLKSIVSVPGKWVMPSKRT